MSVRSKNTGAIQRVAADQAKKRLRGQPEAGLSRERITRNVRLGREQAEDRDADWPNADAAMNPMAATLKKATDEALRGLTR